MEYEAVLALVQDVLKINALADVVVETYMPEQLDLFKTPELVFNRIVQKFSSKLPPISHFLCCLFNPEHQDCDMILLFEKCYLSRKKKFILWRRYENDNGYENLIRHSFYDMPEVRNNILKWFKDDKLHRDDNKPAFIGQSPFKTTSDLIIYRGWSIDNKPGRTDGGPTCIDQVGTQYWEKEYTHNFHRDEDLPAVIFANGTMEWYKDGKRHRDGLKPAIITKRGQMRYWKHGRQVHLKNGMIVDKKGNQVLD